MLNKVLLSKNVFYAKSIFLTSKNKELRPHQADRNRLYEGFCTSLLMRIWLKNGSICGRTEPEFCFHWKPGSENIRGEISLIFFRSNLDFNREFQWRFYSKNFHAENMQTTLDQKGSPTQLKNVESELIYFSLLPGYSHVFCYLSEVTGSLWSLFKRFFWSTFCVSFSLNSTLYT